MASSPLQARDLPVGEDCCVINETMGDEELSDAGEVSVESQAVLASRGLLSRSRIRDTRSTELKCARAAGCDRTLDAGRRRIARRRRNCSAALWILTGRHGARQSTMNSFAPTAVDERWGSAPSASW